MTRARRAFKGTEQGIAKALRESFKRLDYEADAEMERHIQRMMDFEGSNKEPAHVPG